MLLQRQYHVHDLKGTSLPQLTDLKTSAPIEYYLCLVCNEIELVECQKLIYLSSPVNVLSVLSLARNLLIRLVYFLLVNIGVLIGLSDNFLKFIVFIL